MRPVKSFHLLLAQNSKALLYPFGSGPLFGGQVVSGVALVQGPGPEPRDRQSEADSGITSLVMMLAYLRIPVDPLQIRHEHVPDGQSLDCIGVVRAARRLGVKAKAVTVAQKRLATAPLPA